MKQLLLLCCAFSFVSPLLAQKPTLTIFKPDGSIKARRESEFKDGKIIKTEVRDAEGRLEFVERPVDGQSKDKRVLSDGSDWPYTFVVYGAAALGGIGKVATDVQLIKETIAKIDTDYPIREILFLSKDRAWVQTGIVTAPLNGAGRFHSLKKEGSQWVDADKPGTFRGWVS